MMLQTKNFRHPLFIVRDQVLRAFFQRGFTVFDSGDRNYVIRPEENSSVWHEPEQLAALSDDPILLNKGKSILRTRLLSEKYVCAGDKKIGAAPVFYKGDPHYPGHMVVQGFVKGRSEEGFFEELGIPFLKECGVSGALKNNEGFAFSIDLDELAVKTFSLENRAALFGRNKDFLERFEDGGAAENGFFARIEGLLRELGFLRISEDIFAYDGIYRKTNMIKDAWDLNNYGYRLVTPEGPYDQLRTVPTPMMEGALALNYAEGKGDLKLFEIGHVFTLSEEGYMPDEKDFLIISSYGNGDLQAFEAEIRTFLEQLGISDAIFGPISIAAAYKSDECSLILSRAGKYLGGNAGHINPKALDNYGIKTPAYMANFDLKELYRNLDNRMEIYYG